MTTTPILLEYRHADAGEWWVILRFPSGRVMRIKAQGEGRIEWQLPENLDAAPDVIPLPKRDFRGQK